MNTLVAIVVFGGGAIAAMVVLVVLIGLFLPESTEGKSSRRFAVSTGAVWEALIDYERHPMTGKMAGAFRELASDNDLPAWIEDMKHGEPIEVRTLESRSELSLVRAMSSTMLPMTSRWTYDLITTDDGCRLSLHGVTDIKSGNWRVPIFRFMMLVGGGVKKGLDIQLDMIEATLEA